MSSPSAAAAKRISTPSGFVQCSVHNVRRKADCCEMKPVLNADMEVIDYVCVCKPAFACKSASERNHQAARGAANDKRSNDDQNSGTSSLPVVIDASSTSMNAVVAGGHAHGHAALSSSADANNTDVATLFSVTFHGGNTTAGTTTISAQGKGNGAEKALDVDGADGEHDDSDVDSNESTDSTALTFPASPKLVTTNTINGGQGGEVRSVSPSLLQPAAHRARPRYYDPLQSAAGGRSGNGGHAQPAKVCWNCGMPGHEKPACPNTLCRTCHQKRGPYGVPHRCVPVTAPSPFIVLPTISAWNAEVTRPRQPGEAEGMSAVRCVACNEYGHFDCSVAVSGAAAAASISSSSDGKTLPADVVPLTTPFTCCYCGVQGHTVFECHQRDRTHPDLFERRHQLAAENLAAGGAECRNQIGNNSSCQSDSGNWSQGRGGYGQQQQQQLRSYGGPSGSSSGNNLYNSCIGGHRRERTWDDDHNDGHNSSRQRDYNTNNDNSRSRRHYEAPSMSYVRDQTGSSRSFNRNNNNSSRYNNLSSGQQQYHHHHGDRQSSSTSYGGQGSSRRYDDHSYTSNGGRSYSGRYEERRDIHRRDQRSGSGGGGYGGRRGKNRGYDSGDDLF